MHECDTCLAEFDPNNGEEGYSHYGSVVCGYCYENMPREMQEECEELDE